MNRHQALRRLAAISAALTVALGATAGLDVATDRPASAAGTVDITDLPGTLTDPFGTTGVEGADKAVDNVPYTKYFTPNGSTWLQYVAQTSAIVTGYTITSANDAPDRDPRSWVLETSDTGTSWTPLNTQTNQTFIARFQKNSYSFTNTIAHRFYRLRITATNGSTATQLGEWQLLGTSTATTPVPQAPSALTAQTFTGDQIILNWLDNTRWETRYRLERSTDGSTWPWFRNLPAGTTRFTSLGLSGSTRYFYRVRAENSTGVSAYTSVVSATTLSPDLPTTWQEHWFDHFQLVTRVSYNNDAAVYFDSSMDPGQAAWLTDFVTRLWQYTKRNYGSFSNPRLAAVVHNANIGGHAATVFDPNHDYRNTIDVGILPWSQTNPEARAATSHEIGHIVELSSLGVQGSPAFPLWSDSKWNEIFQYDAYLGAGFTADATNWFNKMQIQSDPFPRANTFWFRDWFYPIWRDHGQGAVLARYFQLLAANFHQYNGAYARDLNWGEFVHFWSGAAGVNLKPLATAAFGWPPEWEQQFNQARLDFPGVTYV